MATAAANQIKARHLPALDDSARQLVLAAAHPVDHSLVEIIELVALSGEIARRKMESKRGLLWWRMCNSSSSSSSSHRYVASGRQNRMIQLPAREHIVQVRDVAWDAAWNLEPKRGRP